MTHRDEYLGWAAEAADYLRRSGLGPCDVAIQCGSGLSGLLATLGGGDGAGGGVEAGASTARTTDVNTVEMANVPHLKAAGVRGHGRIVAGLSVGDRRVLVFAGRLHLYEGHSALDVAFPASIAKACGARLFIATNAAGGLNQHLRSGEALLHTDFINFQREQCVESLHCPEPAERFVDPKPAYDPAAGEALSGALVAAGLSVRRGVYVSVRGPLFETRAELHMLRGFGADAVGMSTAQELLMCHFLGLPCLGVSIITNECFAPGAVSHEQVLAESAVAAARLGAALRTLCETAPSPAEAPASSGLW
jgi:purine-nucleoside phosphorylase